MVTIMLKEKIELIIKEYKSEFVFNDEASVLSFDDLFLASLDTMAIFSDVKNILGVEIPDDAIDSIKSPQDILDFVSKN